MDVGADYAAEAFFFGVNFFHREIKGVIEEVDTGIDIGAQDLFRVENVGDGYVHGLELEQRLNLGALVHPRLDGLTLMTNQTLMRSELTDQSGFKRRFAQQPNQIANVSLIYRLPGTQTLFTIAANYVSDVPNDTATKIEGTEEEVFVDLYAEFGLAGPYRFYARAENLTDEGRFKHKHENGKFDIEKESIGRTLIIGLKAAL